MINAPLGTDGRLSGPTLERLVVYAGHKEETQFLKALKEVPYIVYQDKNATAWLKTPQGAGDEARAYLKFIVDNYDRLPDRMVFAHLHQFSWHHVVDGVGRIKALRWRGAPQFANLRASDVNQWQSNLWPTELQYCFDKDATDNSVAFQMLWKDAVAVHINGTADALPPRTISAPCCGEFTVTSQRVRARPLELYEDMLAWTTSENGEMENFYRGRAYEYMWHIVFGEPAVTGAVELCTLYDCGQYRALERVAESGACELGKRAGCGV